MYFFHLNSGKKLLKTTKNVGQTQGKVRNKTVVNPAANDKLREKIMWATN